MSNKIYLPFILFTISICLLKAQQSISIQQANKRKLFSKYRSLFKVSPQIYETINLQLNTDETILVPVDSILPQQYKLSQGDIARVTQVTHNATHTKSSGLCSIVRAPNYKPYTPIHKINHKIRDVEDWLKLSRNNNIIYKLEDIKKLQYAIDMEVISSYIVVIFEDGEIIFYQLNQNQDKLEEVGRKQIFSQQNRKLSYGKILLGNNSNQCIFISSTQIILIRPKYQSFKTLAQFPQPHLMDNENDTDISVTSSILLNQNIIVSAQGSKGIQIYQMDWNQEKIEQRGNYRVYVNISENNANTSIFVAELLQITQLYEKDAYYNSSVLAILDPNYGILTITLNLRESTNQTVPIEANRTFMKNKNCRFLVLHNQSIYTSCPQVVSFDPVLNKMNENIFLVPLPQQLLPGSKQLTIISHSTFQKIDKCTGKIEQGQILGSFHHTVRIGDYYVSIDDLSLTLWTTKYPVYFLACKSSKKFSGLNTFNLTVTSFCKQTQNTEQQCCHQIFNIQLKIHNSEEGIHLFEILGVILVLGVATGSTIYILNSKRKLNAVYVQLSEQNENTVAPQKIHETEQSINEKNNKFRTFQKQIKQ